MNKELVPFPNSVKYVGWILISAGIILGILFAFFNVIINMPVFAIFSSFLETKYFAVFTTNFTDELTLLLLLGGVFLVVFSREKSEDMSEEKSLFYNKIRTRSLFKALYYNTFMLIFSILFIFGQGFFWVLVINLLSVFILYLFIFEVNKRRPMNN